jgi:8-oxo-dGTP diphosphatase
MRRSPNARLFPGKWAPIGGHLEAEEINDPQAACLREIREETGLTDRHLINLSLRYIVHRRRDNEIRTQYVYFGSATEERVGRTDEGELCWVPFDRITDLDVSDTTRFTLEHYTARGSQTDCVYVGAVGVHDGKPVISWTVLRDWE